MRKHLLTGLIIALILPALAACGSSQQAAYHGSLYFAQGPYLMNFSLGDGSFSVVDNLGDKTVREISSLGDGKLLIAETAWISSKAVPRISWIDLETGQSSVLYSGYFARYLAATGVIVYDDGSRLYAVPQLGNGADEVVFSHAQEPLTAMTDLSGRVLLFETGAAKSSVIHSWDADTGQLQRLEALSSACRLSGAVWIEPLQRLACQARGEAVRDAEYVFTGLDGVIYDRLQLPAEKRFFALTFIPGQHAVILRETRQGLLGGPDKAAVWAYDIRNGGIVRLAKNVNLGSSAIYAEF